MAKGSSSCKSSAVLRAASSCRPFFIICPRVWPLTAAGAWGSARYGGNIGGGVLVLVCQNPVGPEGGNHVLIQGVKDGGIQAGLEGQGQKGAVEKAPPGQAKGDVAHPQGGFYT